MSLLHLEPVGWYEEGIGLMDEKHFDSLQPVYTEAQLKAEIEATKEKAAKVCEDFADKALDPNGAAVAVNLTAAIRSMK